MNPNAHQLSDADVRLLTRLETGETTVRGTSALREGESLGQLVDRLLALRDRGLLELSDGRIMRNQAGRVLGAGPGGLTPVGKAALEHDRRLGPRA